MQKLRKCDITQQHIDLGDVPMGNHLFVIFAVLDVSLAVNLGINCSFLNFITYRLQTVRTEYFASSNTSRTRFTSQGSADLAYLRKSLKSIVGFINGIVSKCRPNSKLILN